MTTKQVSRSNRSSSLNKYVFLLTAGLALLLTLAACVPPGGVGGGVRVGDAIPSFDLQTPDGESYSSEGLEGTPYIISVFATWCPPCKDEMQHFERDIWQPLKDSGVGVYGINYGDEDADLITEFAQQNNLTFPLLVDYEGDFRQQVGIRGVPTSYVVGKDGKVISVHEGYTESAVAEMKEQLQNEL